MMQSICHQEGNSKQHTRSMELRKQMVYVLLPSIFLNDKKNIHNMHWHLDFIALESFNPACSFCRRENGVLL
jgi:hypothetical protein